MDFILFYYNIYLLCKQSKLPRYNAPRPVSDKIKLIGYSPGKVYFKR